MHTVLTPTLSTGALLDERYEIVRVLGVGTMGVVYEGRDRRACLEKQAVALKQMPGQSVLECERLSDLSALLVHPSVPRIIGYFSQDGSSYLVQEMIQGENLEDYLENHEGCLDEATALDWAIQLCGLLDYLHTHPVYPLVFRDLKPSNLMVDGEGRVYAVDFGLARVFPPGFLQQTPPSLDWLWQGLAIGTEGYAPPEQYKGLACPASDLYGLGATLHHLLTRLDPRKEHPFSFDQRPIRQYHPLVSPRFEAVIVKALEPQLERRYTSAREMQDDLFAIKKDQ